MIRSYFPFVSFAFGLIAVTACGGSESVTIDDAGRPATSGAGGSATGGTGGMATGGSGGETPVDASGPVPCTAGTVTFHMTAGSGSNSSYCVGSACVLVWVTVTSADGKPIPFSQDCVANCADCQPIGCPGLCIAPQHLTPEGETLTWDGTYWDPGTCGAQLTCRSRRCAAPGKYTAKMCAYRSTSDASTGFCMGVDSPTCVNVPFDYPSATVVEGVLNP